MKNTNIHKKHRKVAKRKTMRGGAARYPTSSAASHRPSHGPSASSHGPSAVASHGPIDKRIGVSDIPLQTNINHITLSYKKGAHFFSCVGIPIEKLQDRYDATTKTDHAPILGISANKLGVICKTYLNDP